VTRGVLIALTASLTAASPASTQARPQWDGVPPVQLTEGTMLLHTADEPNITVRVMANGLEHPWSMAFLPDGNLLVTERPGRLRIVRDGRLDQTPIAGVPPVSDAGTYTGLLEVALHPRFAENRYVYITYRTADEDARVVLARARFDGTALQDSLQSHYIYHYICVIVRALREGDPMSDDPKEPLNFRLGRSYKEALERLAGEQDKPVSQLVREVVETYVADEARAAWEAEARRTAAELAAAARDPDSDEAVILRSLDASLEEFAAAWAWDDRTEP
jgi:hypothetical protein